MVEWECREPFSVDEMWQDLEMEGLVLDYTMEQEGQKEKIAKRQLRMVLT